MKILNCQISNFASYEELNFEFTNQGLTLISGPTGAGKSTLCDVVPWILFGRTAKGGAVDEIRSWGSNKTAYGRLTIDMGDYSLSIVRTRKPNDLYYMIDGVWENTKRGKDLVDTQKQINELLGFDYDLYMSAAYFHEFSQTASFFSTTAKVRRQITEQLVDLTLAKKLVENTTAYRKEVKSEINTISNELNTTAAVIASLKSAIQFDTSLSTQWEAKHKTKLADLTLKSNDYLTYASKQMNKALKEHTNQQKDIESELQDLEASITPETDISFYKAALLEERRHLTLTSSTKCPVCGNLAGKDKELLLLKRENELTRMEQANENAAKSIRMKNKDLEKHKLRAADITTQFTASNPYVKQLEDLIQDENPYTGSINERKREMKDLTKKIKIADSALKEFTTELADLELLLDVTDSFRALLITNTVNDLETNANTILETYFDAEIQVKFELTDTDKLEVIITKDGNECVFTQLSKGQRQLLKLSFAVSVMKSVANHHGISFNALFFDEALDGLDDVLKVKAYDLLQRLSVDHESVFVVEHNEALKSLFPKRYEVSLTNEGSQLGEA